MNAQEIASKLNELSEIQSALDVARMDYNSKREEILAQVKDQLDALELECAPGMAIAAQRIDELTGEIKTAVISAGASVKADHLHAVYTRGRVTWDGKKLDGMMSLIPQLADARREGEPSVSIRAVK